MYLRRNFSRSGLVRLLGDLDNANTHASGAPVAATDMPGADLAQRLSLWVGVFEAGTLHAVHQAAASAPARALPAAAVSPGEQLKQVRAILTRAIAAGSAADGGTGRALQPLSQPAPATDTEIDFAPYRQHCQDLQRNMEMMITPLRDSVRQALSAASPGLRRLAALDAVWEQMLAGREQKMMAAVPARLRRRFESLRKAGTDNPSQERPTTAGPRPAGWLQVFSGEMRQVLLAELDVRLEPVTGLIEAFEQEGSQP